MISAVVTVVGRNESFFFGHSENLTSIVGTFVIVSLIA